MVVIKFKKKDEGMFFSHLNLVSLLNRIMSLSGVDIKYFEDKSKGKRMFFNSPTRVGIESECEYLSLDTNEVASVVESKIVNNLPSWLTIDRCLNTLKIINVASLNTYAKYKVTFDGYKSSKAKIKTFLDADNIIIKTTVHGEEQIADVKDKIVSYTLLDDGLEIIAGVGNNGVRIDELVSMLVLYLFKRQVEFSIVKKELYGGTKKELATIDQLIERSFDQN